MPPSPARHARASRVVLVHAVWLALSAGCASAGRPAEPEIPVVQSAASPAAAALSRRFFAEGSSSPAFAAELRAALAADPASGALHEVAAYVALLSGDDDGAWRHFLSAAADTGYAGAALDLYELGRLSITRSQIDATIAALARIAASHADAGVRARAASLRAGYLRQIGRRDEAAEEVRRLGFLRSAMILGSFDNEDGKGFTEAYPPEARVDLAAKTPGAVLPVAWRQVDALPFHPTIPLADLLYPNQHAVGYLAVWVSAPASTAATLRISTDAPVAAWANGAPIAREDRIRHYGFDNVTAKVTLGPAPTEILVKSGVKTGGWNLGLRLTDAAGAPVPGLTVALSPPPGFARPSAPPAASPPPTTPAAPADPRGAFAAARMLMAHGLYQPGLALFEQLLKAQPRHELVRYFTADAAELDHQVERALDLLTSGISAQRALPAFLRGRATIYRQKELWTQAQRDLEQVAAAQPGARLARLELADVFGRRRWDADRVRVVLGVLDRWPDSAAAHLSLGSARDAQGYRDRAERAYRAAVELEPGNAGAWRAIRKLAEERGSPGDTERADLRLAEIDPLDVSDRLARAEVDRTRGDARAAERELRAISAYSPDHPTPYLRRAQLADESNRAGDALALYQAAQDRDPRDSWLAERLQQLRPETEDVLRAYTPTDDAIDLAVKRTRNAADAASHVEEIFYETATALLAEGSSRTVRTEVARALSQKGRDELVRLPLPEGGQVRVLKAFAETPDGQRQEASSVDRASVRFRNLEVGSTVVLQYVYYPRRGSGALGQDYFSEQGFAAVGRHIDHMRWVLVAPQAKELHLEVDPRVRATTGTLNAAGAAWKVHEFSRDDVAAIPSEPSMVPSSDLAPHVVVTTLPAWDSFIRWEKAILDESFPADPALDALALRLVGAASTPREKLGKLFAYVAQEVRYQQEYESILAGWQPHRSAVVLERKYGDCKDKSTLLIALARAVGVDLEFAVLATHRLGHPSHAVVFPKFNHAIVYVPRQPGIDEPFFMDPTVDALDLWSLRDDDQGAAALVVNPTTGMFTWREVPYQAPEYRTQRWKSLVEIESPEKVTARSHLELKGSHAASFRSALRSDDQSRQVYDYLVSQFFPGGRLKTASAPDHESLFHPLAIDQEIDASLAIRAEGSHFRLKLPNEAESAPVKLAERQTPLDLGTRESTHAEVTVHLSKAVKLVERPAAVDVTDPCFHIRRAVTGDRTSVVVTEDFEQTCTTISAADYPRYRAAMERARSLLDSALVFDRVGPAPSAPGLPPLPPAASAPPASASHE